MIKNRTSRKFEIFCEWSLNAIKKKITHHVSKVKKLDIAYKKLLWCAYKKLENKTLKNSYKTRCPISSNLGFNQQNNTPSLKFIITIENLC